MKKKNTLGVARTLNTFGVFKDHETDWTFKRTLGYMGEQGAQIGECLYAASRINERVPESWMNEWAALGAKVEAQGAHSLEVGNNESARDSFIRASNYYRTAEYGCPPSHPRFHELWRKGVECMHKALPLFERPAVPVSIPYEGKMMPGYFVRPDESGAKRPTLILVGGNDSTIEEILLIGGIAAARRGFNFLTFDYPGHRGFVHTYYPEGTKRVDNVPAFKAAIDFLLTLPGVDDRIALSGGSMGGYVVTQVAIHEPRIRALIPNSPVIDLAELVGRLWAPLLARIPRKWVRPILRWRLRNKPLVKAFMEYSFWSWGYPDLNVVDFFTSDVLKGANLTADLPKITCPVLALAGEGEGDIMVRQAREFFDGVSSKHKRIHIFTLDGDGSDDHCQLDNLTRSTQIVFDWLIEVFGRDVSRP